MSSQRVSFRRQLYSRPVPKLWSDTIETHRREVREAILDTTAKLVAEKGLRAVTMSKIAERTGIGRATLYKYFPDIELILLAWHERHVQAHFGVLRDMQNQPGSAAKRLEAVLEAYALIQNEHHSNELVALLHRGEHVARARRQLRELIRHLLTEAVQAGELRKDIAPDELATFCLSALGGATALSSKAAVRRLVTVTMDGLRQRP